MTKEKIETIMARVSSSAVWYNMFQEKLIESDFGDTSGEWKIYKNCYKEVLQEIREMLND
tara:strand:- start:708 stop:887 length:180 start_codon:yes stop_codon:yes gene_type:complete